MVKSRLNSLNLGVEGHFDRVVWLTIAGLLLLTGLFIWRGDSVGVPVRSIVPARNAGDVSGKTPIQITFGQPMNTAETPEITLDPPVNGTTKWQGATTLVFRPEQPLSAETEYTVHLSAGPVSKQGRLVLKPVSWRFETRPLQILYMSWNEDNYYQLFAVSPDGGTPTALTFPPDDVLDFAVSPNGASIAYSSYRQDGGSDLYLIDSDGKNRQQLLDCAQGACSNPSWDPNGRRLIYERRTIRTEGSAPGPPRLWWLDLTTNQTVAVFEDTQWLGSFARFSPDGQWIAYISPSNQEILAYELASGRSVHIPSSSGEPANWSITSDSVLMTEIDFSGEQYSIYIYQVALETAEVTRMSGDDLVIDGWPTWSPDGQWIAFNRKPPLAPTGKQLWVMPADGSERIQLTNDPGLHHGPPAWSPDGEWLVYQQFAQAEPNAEPEIWMLNVKTHETRKVASPGNQPVWLP
ncbi:MAG: Ig-like domain-containing protein [Candidatus Promineifilaceae bacterium]